MTGLIDEKLTELGVLLPQPTTPRGNYVPCVRFGDFVMVSGQLPFENGQVLVKGEIGKSVSVEDGQRGARLSLINVLAHLRTACMGDLDRVRRVIRLGGFVVAQEGFLDHATVMNGASDLAVAVFGEIGRHARTTIGVHTLPGGAAVAVEGLFEIARQ